MKSLDRQGKSDMLRDSVELVFVLAVGPAYQAMLYEKKPDLLSDIRSTNFVPIGEGHEEL